MEQGPGGAGRREGPSVQKHRVGLEQEGKRDITTAETGSREEMAGSGWQEDDVKAGKAPVLTVSFFFSF